MVGSDCAGGVVMGEGGARRWWGVEMYDERIDEGC